MNAQMRRILHENKALRMLNAERKIFMNTPSHRYYGQLFALLGFFLLAILFYLSMKNYFAPVQHEIISEYAQSLLVKQSPDRHYRISGAINDVPVTFMIDTGASDIAVNEQIAAQSGLKKSATLTISTANGKTTAWLTHIESLKVGHFIIENMPAIIVPKMENEVLLGMRFLSQFTFSQSNGVLTLEQK